MLAQSLPAQSTAVAVLLLFAWRAESGSSVHTQSPQRTPITVEDLVRQAVIGDPNSLTWNDSAAKIGITSADDKHVAVVVRRGDPQRGTNIGELLVYDTAQLLSAPKAQVAARFASATKYQPLALVRWLADSNNLVFAGTQADRLSQIYRTDLRTGELRQLTNLGSQLLWHDITASGNWLATVSAPAPLQSAQCRGHAGCLITAETLYGAEHGVSEISADVVLHDLRDGSSRTFEPPEAGDPDLIDCRNELKGGLSPDGRFGLRICKLRPHRWPHWWADYTASPELGKLLAAGINGALRQWVLYDFQRGAGIRLSAAPYFMQHYESAAPLWIDEGRQFILAGAFEPLGDVDARERSQRTAHYAVLVVDPLTRKIRRIAYLDSKVHRVTAAAWDWHAEMLTIESVDSAGKSLPKRLYHRVGERWIDVKTTPSAIATIDKTAAKPQLIIKQSLNDRPVLAAVNPLTSVTNVVLDPDPWLDERALGHVEMVSWKSKDGREWAGQLYYPPQYEQGVRYPVVLQTHGYKQEVFSLYGAARNFAAQPLAGLGILVLQIAENTAGAQGVDEWPAAQAGYEAAVDDLDSRGLIDRKRMGIQGWSRTGPYAGYTLTHSSYAFAAGVFTETADYGWWHYMLQGGRSGENEYGTPPFGDGFEVWRKMSPSFNLDRVNAPMLMCVVHASGLWDWYAGLRRLGKPVEYWALPNTTHDVLKVEERMTINQLVVDWFRFWLKDEKDSNPAKREQYGRWDAMKPSQAKALPSSDRTGLPPEIVQQHQSPIRPRLLGKQTGDGGGR